MSHSRLVLLVNISSGQAAIREGLSGLSRHLDSCALYMIPGQQDPASSELRVLVTFEQVPVRKSAYRLVVVAGQSSTEQVDQAAEQYLDKANQYWDTVKVRGVSLLVLPPNLNHCKA